MGSWRHRSRHVVLSRTAVSLDREVARILGTRGLRELSVMVPRDGTLGLVALGYNRSMRWRTVRRRVAERCTYCAVEGLVRRLPTEVLDSTPGLADRVVEDYRQALAVQPGAVRIFVREGFDGWVIEGEPVSSKVPRYEPEDCLVHSNLGSTGRTD
ncbi:hypothetical protein ACWDCB_19765 [Streptomyces sp. NPDC001178]